MLIKVSSWCELEIDSSMFYVKLFSHELCISSVGLFINDRELYIDKRGIHAYNK